MNLIVDAGNSFVKLAVFENEAILYDTIIETSGLIEGVKEVFGKYPKIGLAIVSSVVNLPKRDIDALTVLCDVHVLGHHSKTPFKNRYATPQTLGVDRIALATSAYYHYHNRNCLVIDAGTCITYDFVNAQGEYLGGAISPGLTMRYKALNDHTSKLPFLEVKTPNDLIGTTTESSIHSGIVNGIIGEIDGVIDQYKSRYKDLTVILTGGDALFLSKRLKNTIFANSKFLLEGLNYLLDYNKR
ncbi:MAG: type III pantothenate kinase [Maribacter sp.]|nr:type III pantothenate kinase [Maribacter sp.]